MKDTITAEEEGVPVVYGRKDMLSTGSTLLNLAMTGHPDAGFLKGHYYFLVGDSQSGKTFLSMTCCAEATINPAFKDYDLIYDNVEDGMLMDLDTLFNEAVADRIRPPATDGDEPVFSTTIEEFYYHVDDAVKSGRPFIYILDSMDSLDSEAAGKKFDQHKKAYRKQQARKRGEDVGPAKDDDKVAGSYGDGKAKKNSENLRKLMAGLRDTGSILIILSQTRDNPAAMFNTKTRAGGHALKFYATTEIWSSVDELIKKTVNDKDRHVGNRVKLQIRKSRITGKYYTVTTDIYPSFGIDDVGSCVDYLVEEGWWPMEKQTITAKGLNITGTREKIIRTIEKHNLEADLRAVCGQCWQDIEEKCVLVRKNKYAQATE